MVSSFSGYSKSDADHAQRAAIGKENLLWGHDAENIAAEYFLKQGYTVRERNWKCGRLEIDLILEKERTIIFVEVKARKAGTQDPIEAVDRDKRIRIIRAADSYLRSMTQLYQYRFDIFTVTGSREDYKIEHYADAYMPTVNGKKC